MIDSRLENYLETLAYDNMKQKDKADEKLREITNASERRRHQITDLITAMALKKTGRQEDGEALLKQWMEKQPDNQMAKWAYAVFKGEKPQTNVEGNDNFRVIRSLFL